MRDNHWTGNESQLRGLRNQVFDLQSKLIDQKFDHEKELAARRDKYESDIRFKTRYYEEQIVPPLLAEIKRLKLAVGPMDAILTVKRRICG